MYIKKILLVIVLMTLVVGGIFSYSVYNRIFESNTAFAEEKIEVFIPSDATFKEVLQILKPHLKDIQSFSWLASKKGYSKRVKAGRYILKKGSNNDQMINVLRSQNQAIKVSFNNQERIENLAGRIAQQIESDSLSLLKAFTNPQFLKEKGFSNETALSMYIPNSYQVYWNTSAEAFRDKMFKEYERFWNSSRTQKAKEIGLTPIQVSTLAAIVHKETVKSDERPKVAGVYMNRLNKNMKLDADPTVIYAVKKYSKNWNQVIKRVLNKDLEVNSPYNTYKVNGLPPGPIMMPDISAIDAVLNYQKHDYLFFVASTQNFGYHKFAKTLAQHNQNSRAYHQWVNKNKIYR